MEIGYSTHPRHAVIRKFVRRNHELPLAFLSQPCYNKLGDQTKPKIDGSPKKGPSIMDRKPLPYMENPENAGKPWVIRHTLLTGHMEKEARRRRLDEIVAQYAPGPVGQNHFLVNITEWMISWYDVLGCNAVDPSVSNGGGLGPGSGEGEREILGVGFNHFDFWSATFGIGIEIRNGNVDGGLGVGLGVGDPLYAWRPRFQIRGERKLET
jgi:hypothetical protein